MLNPQFNCYLTKTLSTDTTNPQRQIVKQKQGRQPWRDSKQTQENWAFKINLKKKTPLYFTEVWDATKRKLLQLNANLSSLSLETNKKWVYLREQNLRDSLMAFILRSSQSYLPEFMVFLDPALVQYASITFKMRLSSSRAWRSTYLWDEPSRGSVLLLSANEKQTHYLKAGCTVGQYSNKR